MPFLIIFLSIPLIELALFIAVADEIGFFGALALCILSAITGLFLVQWQGVGTLLSLRRALDEGRMPVQELFDGACLALAGLLLIIPGFFTDIIALLLIIPGMRRLVRAEFARRGFGKRKQAGDDIIDAEFVRTDETSTQRSISHDNE